MHVRLLGDLQLRRGHDGALLPLPPSRRTRALLGYLVATGAPQSRAALCDLLWDGPDDPRAALRWSLTKLRPLLDSEGRTRLRADRDKVAFEPQDCEVDTVRITTGLGSASLAGMPLQTLEAAAQALQGVFLEGLDLPGCYRFHPWCMAERDRFARLRREVLQTLVGRLADDDPGRALGHARAMAAADPLIEAAQATLVKLLAQVGRYPDAEAHYLWARELLRRELALPDGGLLDQAIRRVRQLQRQRPGPAQDTATAAHPDAAATAVAPPEEAVTRAGIEEQDPAAFESPSAPALVGRDNACQAIEAALDTCGPSPVLLFVGEPGLGKTRLLDHLAGRATTRGWRVLRARCFEAESVRPYGFWLDALRGVSVQGVDDAVVARAAPLLGGGPGAATREALFEAACALLESLAQQQPLVLLVDDLQWADDSSAALLHAVVRRLVREPRPFLCAAAARLGEVDDNAAAKRVLQSLARERVLQRHDLRPLSADEAQRWLGTQLPDIDEAVRASGGNPLYLQELARAGPGTPEAGRPLEDLIAERLLPLDDAARDLLGWCAAMGGPFAAERLAVATALPVAEVLGRLAAFERRGLLHAGDDGGFDFAHGLVRQAVYRTLATPRRRALHGQIAQAFAQASAEDPWQHGPVVHHATLAGDIGLAARAALAAGEHWLRVFANVEAAQVAERGLVLIDGLPPGAPRVRLEIGLLRLRVAAAAAPGTHGLPDLAARLQQAIAAALALDLPAEASSAWEILAFWRQCTGDTAGAHEATLAAEQCTRRADAHTRCRQLANTGRCLLDIESDPDRARALLDEAAALAAELQLPVMELEWGRGLAARAAGDLERAHASLARAVAQARAAVNHWREYECMLALATVEYEQGLTEAVVQHADEIATAARRMGESQVPYADALAALARTRRGDADGGAAVQASIDALRERDDQAHLAYVLIEAAQWALAQGQPATAAVQAREAHSAAATVRRPSLIARAQAIATAAQAAAVGRL